MEPIKDKFKQWKDNGKDGIGRQLKMMKFRF